MTCAAVVNPRSAGGATGRRWSGLARALESRVGDVTTRFTERPGHATVLTRELLERGFDRVIAVGGDGTINEVANGFLRDDQPVRPGASLAILPAGTGGDFRRTLGIAGIREALDVLARGSTRPIDVGRVSYDARDGSRATRYFVNVVSFGMGGEVAARSRNWLSPLGGRLAFLWATAVVFFQYQGKTVRLRLDDGAPEEFTVMNVAVGNGRYHGGGMHVCPRASTDDGLLEVTVIDRLGMIEMVRSLPVLYSENIYVHPKTRHRRARRVTAESAEATSIEVDGEPLGQLPVEITVLPRRLPVCTG